MAYGKRGRFGGGFRGRGFGGGAHRFSTGLRVGSEMVQGVLKLSGHPIVAEVVDVLASGVVNAVEESEERREQEEEED